MKFGIRGHLTDVITCVKFLVDRFRGYGVLTPPKLPFPIDLLRRSPLQQCGTTVRHCDTSVTRGNKFKLQNQSYNHNFRKIFFSARIVNIWNSLPNYVVDVQSIDVFKVHLDQFWAQQEVMFDIGLQT